MCSTGCTFALATLINNIYLYPILKTSTIEKNCYSCYACDAVGSLQG